MGVGDFGLKRVNSIIRSRIAELTYVVDVNKDFAQKISRELRVNYVSFEELLQKKGFDVAIVAVSNFLHYEHAIILLEHRRDVWCKRPMSISVELARKMVLKSMEKKAILKVGSNPR
jgi:predicted dehydrogenase